MTAFKRAGNCGSSCCQYEVRIWKAPCSTPGIRARNPLDAASFTALHRRREAAFHGFQLRSTHKALRGSPKIIQRGSPDCGITYTGTLTAESNPSIDPRSGKACLNTSGVVRGFNSPLFSIADLGLRSRANLQKAEEP